MNEIKQFEYLNVIVHGMRGHADASWVILLILLSCEVMVHIPKLENIPKNVKFIVKVNASKFCPSHLIFLILLPTWLINVPSDLVLYF